LVNPRLALSYRFLTRVYTEAVTLIAVSPPVAQPDRGPHRTERSLQRTAAPALAARGVLRPRARLGARL